MTKNDYINQLYNCRLMKTDEEFEEFEIALEKLVDLATEDDIPLLCTVFDDRTEEEEVMFGLIHFIEDYKGKRAIRLTVNGISTMISSSKNWAKIFIYRYLNSEEHREILAQILKESGVEVREKFKYIFNEILIEDKDKFKEKIEEVLKY